MTFLEMAKKTLEKAGRPLTSDQIWSAGIEYNFAQQVPTSGKTPQRTIGAQLYVNIRDDENSDFAIISRRPTAFGLRSWKDKKLEPSVEPESVKKTLNYKERDLHQILSYYAYNYLHVLTKTINDKVSKNGPKGKNEWMHPDMVGLDISSIKDFSKGVLSFSKEINQLPIVIYSFEIKKKIEFSNLRECYFQAVSNSRWANKGYLVCAELDLTDDDLLNELRRLSDSYGIGIIKLDIENADQSEIVNEAHLNELIDWRFINYLFELNPDYETFIESSIDILKTEKIYREKFDVVLDQKKIMDYAKGLSPQKGD